MPDHTPPPFAAPRIGLDIVHVPRFEGRDDHDRLVQRVFSDAERALAGDGPRRAQRLAGRWAAKEAVAKALGCGFGAELRFQDVEILRDEHGGPVARLSEDAAARHGHPVITVSITHDGDYAAAVAVALTPPPEPEATG